MSELEKIQRYIDSVKISGAQRYDMKLDEWVALSRATKEGLTKGADVVSLAFNFGRAKGYRAAKADDGT